MNHITKRNRLQKQLDLYVEFLPLSPPKSKFKLMEEMLTMRNEINRINTMGLRELQTPIFDYTITEKSKINNDSKNKTNSRRAAIPGQQNVPGVCNETNRPAKPKKSRLHHNA